MTSVAVMQPYLFPYIGYFQLIRAVDVFVIYDDVNYIRQGWINRNNILLHGKAHRWTLPVADQSSFRHINRHEIGNPEHAKRKLLKLFESAYRKAPAFDEVYPLLEEVMAHPDANLAGFVANSLRRVSAFIGLDTRFALSSGIPKNPDDSAQQRVIDMVRHIGGTQYCNAIGGQALYSREDFEAAGIRLNFLRTGDVRYEQPAEEFVPCLSIIDVLMSCGRSGCLEHLDKYELI